MKKQGFTLIELMVVVVIIGILAAVAVPKLFGMIAKSKASEVGPAAGTYVKLEQAFISERGNALGNWAVIGYAAPGEKTTSGASTSKTTNFEYTETATFESDTLALSSTDVVGWNAQNNQKLNDCPSQVNWTVSAKASESTSGEATFTAKVVDHTNCLALTPSFENVGK